MNIIFPKMVTPLTKATTFCKPVNYPALLCIFKWVEIHTNFKDYIDILYFVQVSTIF